MPRPPIPNDARPMSEIRALAAQHDFPPATSAGEATCTRCGFRLSYQTVTEIPGVCP